MRRRDLLKAAAAPPLLLPKLASAQISNLIWSALIPAAEAAQAVQFSNGYYGGLQPGQMGAVLVNPGNFNNMPAVTDTLFLSVFYSSTWQFPFQVGFGEGEAPLFGNSDHLGQGSFAFIVESKNVVNWSSTPVLIITLMSEDYLEASFVIPNMIQNDGRFHNLQVSIKPAKFNPAFWNVEAIHDGRSYLGLPVISNDALIPTTPHPSFLIHLLTDSYGQPYTYWVGQQVTAASSGYISFAAPTLPSIRALNGKLAELYFEPNVPVDLSYTVQNQVFQQQNTGLATFIPNVGLVLPGQTAAPPIYLNGDQTNTVLGFAYNQGLVNGIRTNFFTPQPPVSIQPYLILDPSFDDPFNP